MKITLSKKQWETIGMKTGWIKSSQITETIDKDTILNKLKDPPSIWEQIRNASSEDLLEIAQNLHISKLALEKIIQHHNATPEVKEIVSTHPNYQP